MCWLVIVLGHLHSVVTAVFVYRSLNQPMIAENCFPKGWEVKADPSPRPKVEETKKERNSPCVSLIACVQCVRIQTKLDCRSALHIIIYTCTTLFCDIILYVVICDYTPLFVFLKYALACLCTLL